MKAATLILIGVLAAGIRFEPSSTRVAAAGAAGVEESQESLSRLRASVAHMPIYFEENQGQAPSSVRFLARGSGYNLFLSPDGNRVVFKGRVAVHSKLVGANPEPAIHGEEKQAGKVHYLRAGGPLKDIPTYARVRYERVYPGVDLVYYGNQSQLEFDFVLKPGSDPSAIQMRYEGPGALRLDDEGNLILQVDDSEIVQHKPVVFQDVRGIRRKVEGRYRFRADDTIGFELGPYDRSHTLVIDPVLSYATFLGGSNGDDDARAVATDASGNVYLAGTTGSTNFQTLAPFQANAGTQDPEAGLSDAFVTKINAAGAALVYSTYFGGANDDDAAAIAVDSSGNAIIAGTTFSNIDFPTTSGALRRTCNISPIGTCVDAFVAKLNAAGSALIYSTYLGGTGDDYARGLGLDPAGNAYVTGATTSPNFVTTAGAFSTDSATGGFVTKLTAAGAVSYSTYFGAGAGTTEPKSIAVDPAGNAYVTGATPSSAGTGRDVFVTKLNATGTSAIYSQFIRGAKDDSGNAIAVDSAGGAYVAGQTSSIDFTTTAGALQRSYGGGPLFRTQDGGTTWSPAGIGISRSSLYALAVAPGNPPTIYAGADDETAGGIFRSTDGGSTWTASNTGLTETRIHALAVDPTNPATIYAGSRSAGVFKSSNGGGSWSATSLGNIFVTAIVVDPVTPANIYAASASDGVYKSTNGGSTWAPAGAATLFVGARTLAINPAAPATLYAGTGGGIYKTTDSGATWTPMSSGLFDPNINVLVLDPRNPNLLFAGTNSVGVFRSANAGGFWLAANSGLVSSSLGILVSAMTMDPGTGTLYAAIGEANVSRVYKSSNGTTWTPTDLATARVSSLAVQGSGSNSVYAATVGGSDAFAAKWNAAGSLVFSTYIGGYRDDAANSIALDTAGNIHIAGQTSSPNFPASNPVQSAFRGGSEAVTDAFVSKLNTTATALVYSTFLGGNSNDFANGIAVDASGNAYVVGVTGSNDFPIAAALTPARPGLLDAFVAKIIDTPAGAYSVPVRGGAATATQGQTSQITVGYGRIQPANSTAAPSGLAIFGFRQNNILVSEAAVPASSLLAAGRVYAGIEANVQTGLAIANPNAVPVTLNFNFTDRNGQNFGQGTTTIAANGQIASFLNEPPFSGGGNPLQATFSFTSSLPVAAVALRGFTNERAEFLITTLPVADLSVTPGTDMILFPHYADGGGWITRILLVNTTDQAMTGSVELYSPGTPTTPGQPTPPALSYNISARASALLQTAGSAATVSTGSVRVIPSAGTRTPSGVAVFSLRNGAGVTVAEAGVPALQRGNAFRLYAESSGTSGQIGSIETGVAVANSSASPVNVTFELTNLAGTSSGSVGSLTVPANGQVAMFLGQIPAFAALPNPFSGVLRVSTSATSGISVVGLRGRYNERGDFLITTTQPTVESTPASTTEQFFPHLAAGGGYTTQFILFNGATDQSSSGSLRFFAQSGQTLNLDVR